MKTAFTKLVLKEAQPLIAKFYRPQRWSSAAILEEHQFSLELAEHEIPIMRPSLSMIKLTLSS